jgi:uncharacterized protein YdiU (UPF0061 family)
MKSLYLKTLTAAVLVLTGSTAFADAAKVKAALDAYKAAGKDLMAEINKGKVGIDLSKEENEVHLDPVHTMVHPLMTLAAIKKGDMKAAKDELAEGLEQAEGTAKAAGK